MISNMNQDLVIRLSVFIGLLIVMLIWEKLASRRTPGPGMWLRRCFNFILVTIDTLVVRLLIPIAAVGAAQLASERSWGLFNNIEISYWLAIVVSLLLMDLVIYGQHMLFHKVFFLWRLHRVHHTDMDMDVTTGIRFHPFEILLSMCIKIVMVLVLGAPALAVLVFEVVLSGTSLFNHANVYIAPAIDRYLRWFIVTPDMHRVHHSVIKTETDSNYGFNVPWWDRIFGTYNAQPSDGHLAMDIGQNEFRSSKSVNILWLLVQPFLKVDK